MTDNKSFTFKTQPTGLSEMFQPGYLGLDIIFNNIEIQAASATSLIAADLPSHALTNDVVIEADINVGRYVMILLGQAWRFFDHVDTANALPNWSSNANGYEILAEWINCFENGIRNRQARLLAGATGYPVPLTTALTGGIGDNDGVLQGKSLNNAASAAQTNYGWVSRFAYYMGVWYMERFPKDATRIEMASTAIYQNELRLIATIAAIEFAYVLPLLAFQSERAVLAIMAHEEGLIPGKANPDELKSSVDEVWLKLMKEHRSDVLTGTTMNTTAGYSTYVDVPFDNSYLDASTLDSMLQRLNETYVVPKFALDFARTFAGLCTKKFSQTECQVAMLWNLAHATAAGDYNEQGVSTWLAGLNLRLALDVLQDIKSDLKIKMDRVLLNKTHWTFKDMGKFADIWQPFNFKKDLQGFCSPDVVWAAKRRWKKANTTHVTGTPFIVGSHLWDDTTEYAILHQDTKAHWQQDALEESLVWLSAMFYQFDADETDELVILSDAVTYRELYADAVYGMLMDHGETLTAQTPYINSGRLYDIINCRSGEYLCLAYGDDQNQLRHEDVNDLLAGTYESLSVKYGTTLSPHSTKRTRAWNHARPKDVDVGINAIGMWGHPDVKRDFNKNLFSIFSAKPSGSGSASPPPPKGAPPKEGSIDEEEPEEQP